MLHIEKSGFHRREYTALAGKGETLTRYRIYSHDTVWTAIPMIMGTTERDPNKASLTFDTLREMDEHFVSISS